MGLPLNLFKITLKLHHLLNTQNASALQQLLHLYLKQNKKRTKRKKKKKKKRGAKPRKIHSKRLAVLLRHRECREKLCPALWPWEAVMNISQLPMKTCTRHITGDKGRPGGRQEQRWGWREKRHICHAVVFSSEGRHERLVLWETRLWQKEKKKMEENTTQQTRQNRKVPHSASSTVVDMSMSNFLLDFPKET